MGAAVLTDDGRVFTGANVENASYPLGSCAERSAVQAAVSAGARRIVTCAVAGPSPEGATWPCGGCRQVLYEFGPDMVVLSARPDGGYEERRLADLLPEAFGPHDLR